MQAVSRLSPEAAGLTPAEYSRICTTLGREPNDLETRMFGVLWSEHCSYKHSKSLLRRFPIASPRVVSGPGENAGAVDIGDGLVAVMKIESHNHPSAVEPHQGAATGVGGILRDIFAMGARPIALADALFFGPPGLGRSSYLFGGVVGGIASYGNSVGVPTVAGSVLFHSGYAANPLVNVLCLGIAPRNRLLSAQARGTGNPVLLVGAATGRDGIAGASFASAELASDSEASRPAVQVGNPFLEKLLIEACLDLSQGDDIVALQDLGAAGLTGAATEVVARGSCGIEIDVARVSRREAGMVPHEIMLSESQERMLLVVRAGTEDRVQQVFGRWELLANVIGRTTDDGMVRICDGEEVAAELPAAFLSGGAPEFIGAPVAPRPAPSAPLVPPFAEPSDFSSALGRLLGSPNLTSRRVVYEQYDHMVQINTVVPPGEGAAVLRVKGTRKGLVLGLGSHPRHCALDARGGGALAVVEACRNVACAGARPIAVTNCLNFGDPERPRVWQDLSAVVEGMRDACLALDVPIISGNVSLYNESDGAPIPPTPVVGVLGILEQVEHCARAAFQADQEVWLLGALRGELGASEYASFLHGWDGQPGEIDLDSEVRVQRTVRSLVEQGITPTATDVADGGLAIALAELALTSGVGVTCEGEWLDALAAGSLGRRDGVLFGEGAARVIVACARANAQLVREAAAAESVPLTRLGWTGGDEIRIGDLVRVSLAVAYDGWAQALDRLTAGVGGGRRDP